MKEIFAIAAGLDEAPDKNGMMVRTGDFCRIDSPANRKLHGRMGEIVAINDVRDRYAVKVRLNSEGRSVTVLATMIVAIQLNLATQNESRKPRWQAPKNASKALRNGRFSCYGSRGARSPDTIDFM